MEIKKKSERKKSEYEIDKGQVKFFVDLRNEKGDLENIKKLLVSANQKDYGSVINFKELAVFAIKRLGEKDLESLKKESMSEMEKVEQSLYVFNQKNGCSLSLGEYLIKKLNLN